MTERRPFGIVGMFRSSDAILAAARHLRELGFRELEAYTPFPVEGLDQALRPGRRVRLPLLMFVTGLIGGFWGYFIQWWGEAWSYPINVGGRPYNSWPAFMVSAFEIMLLLAITGGLANRIAPLLRAPAFEARFTAKGRYRERMQRVAVVLATCAEPGLLGAAVAFAREYSS